MSAPPLRTLGGALLALALMAAAPGADAQSETWPGHMNDDAATGGEPPETSRTRGRAH